jgi:hypothetical protein
MYFLYVMLLVNIATDVEERVGPFNTIEECWAEAEKIAPSPDVFAVRCTLEEK